MRLRAPLAVEVFDLLRARQQAGLFGVGRIEGHGMLRHGVAFARHDHFAVGQARALRQRFVYRRSRIDTLQPVAQQRLQARVTQAQQVGQARQGLVRGLQGATRHGHRGAGP